MGGIVINIFYVKTIDNTIETIDSFRLSPNSMWRELGFRIRGLEKKILGQGNKSLNLKILSITSLSFLLTSLLLFKITGSFFKTKTSKNRPFFLSLFLTPA